MITILADSNPVGSAVFVLTYAVLVLLCFAGVIWMLKRLLFNRPAQSLYLWKEGQQHGPYRVQDIKAWLLAGQIQPTDMANFKNKWTPLSAVPGIGIAAKKASALPIILGIVGLPGLFGVAARVVSRVGSVAASTPTAANAPVENQLKWQTVSENGFSVLMPGKPVTNERTNDTAEGPVLVRGFVVDTGGEEYYMTYSQYPDTQKWNAIDPQKLFDAVLKTGMLSQGNRKVVSQRELSLNGHPGQETVIEDDAPDGSIYLIRNYWVKPPRLYGVEFFRPKSHNLSANAKKFLDSFKILSQQ